MNIHITDEIRNKYPNMEFVGKQHQREGRTVICVKNHTTNQSFLYSFEEDFFWFANTELPTWLIKK